MTLLAFPAIFPYLYVRLNRQGFYPSRAGIPNLISMKKLLITAALVQLCGLQLLAQESSVKILLNEEERFRFDSIQFRFINSGHHVMLGDSTGMDNTANSLTVESTFIGYGAGSTNQDSYNTFVGARAGEFHVSGKDNVYLGAWAGRYDSTGYHNTFVGANAGIYNKTGAVNTFVGRNTGVCNETGSFNTFMGYGSGFFNKDGNLNSFFGRRSGEHNTYGSENTFIGTSAGALNETGSYNTYIGRGAGLNNQQGDSNIFIGFQAGWSDTSSNRLIIANSETLDPLIYGEFDNKILRFNAERIEIRNSLENTILGDSAGLNNIYGIFNVYIGERAGYANHSIGWNTYIGSQAGYHDSTGTGNVFIGTRSGYSNTSGFPNVFVGATCGLSNTTGSENTFLGTSSGVSNTTGNKNTYIGRRAGRLSQVGSGNVFLGYYSGGNEMGSDKLYIANSDTIAPLIYGEFDNGILKFHADSVHTNGIFLATGEIRTDQFFNTGGFPGISDTVNTVTSIDFILDKLKYRTIIYTGGIVTFLSEESTWSDNVGEFILPQD